MKENTSYAFDCGHYGHWKETCPAAKQKNVTLREHLREGGAGSKQWEEGQKQLREEEPIINP